MESPGARTTSWTAAWLLAEAWLLFAAAGAIEPASALSMRRIFGAAPWIPPTWLAPACSWGAAIGCVLAGVLILRTPVAPAAALLRWQTSYFLWLAIPCLLLAWTMAAAGEAAFGGLGPGLPGAMISGIYGVGVRLFLPLGLLLLGTWWLRRNASRFAGTATAASHLALAAFVPAGPLAILHWWRIVRPVEERPAA